MNESNKELLKSYLINRDQKAYQLLMENNLSLVRFVISKIFSGSPTYIEDLYNEYLGAGCLGLDKAIKSFDINKIDEINFSTYAVTCIRNTLYIELRNENKNKADTISYDELMEDNEFNTSRLIDILQSSDNNINEYIENDYSKYKKEKIKEVLESFKQRDREVIKLYYGFYGKRYNQSQIGEKYNISRSMVATIISRCNKALYLQLSEFKDLYNNFSSIDNKDMYEKYQELYKKYGKNEMIKALNKITAEKRKIVRLFLGIDNLHQSKKDISEILCLPMHIIDYAIDYTYDNLKMLLEENVDNNKKRINHFNNLYTKKMIDSFLSGISKDKKEIFSQYYGIGNCEVMEISELAIKYKKSERTIKNTLSILNKKLKYYSYLNIVTGKELYEFESKLNDNEILELRKEFVNQRVNMHNIDDIYSILDEMEYSEKKVIAHFLGLYNAKIFTIADFEKNFNVSKNKVFNIIVKSIEKIGYNKKKTTKKIH